MGNSNIKKVFDFLTNCPLVCIIMLSMYRAGGSTTHKEHATHYTRQTLHTRHTLHTALNIVFYSLFISKDGKQTNRTPTTNY